MAEVTVDTLLSSIKELQKQQDTIDELADALAVQVGKVETDARVLLGAGNLTHEDRLKLVEGLTDFFAETIRKTMKRKAMQNVKAQAKAEVQAAGGGGFPRLA